VAGLFLLAIIWSAWMTIEEMALRWSAEPTYSHGYLVPLIAAAILWLRRDRFPVAGSSRPNAWGLVLVAIGVACHLAGVFFYVRWVQGFALIPYIAGVIMLLWGWPVLRWALPGVLFLVFMIPLPFTVEMLLHRPLKLLSTNMSTYMLQTLGFPAINEGATILLDTHELGVVDACSGLKMLMIFFALSTAVAVMVNRPILERLLIVASAIPIALIVNVIRITVTGVLYQVASSELADKVFHDLAGWFMMPLALLFLWIELRLFSSVVEEVQVNLPAPVLVTPTTAPGRMPLVAPQRPKRSGRH
jgi:exosortase